jgi:hypothetical protein
MGFHECVVTKPHKKTDWATDNYGINLITCEKIGEVQGLVF